MSIVIIDYYDAVTGCDNFARYLLSMRDYVRRKAPQPAHYVRIFFSMHKVKFFYAIRCSMTGKLNSFSERNSVMNHLLLCFSFNIFESCMCIYFDGYCNDQLFGLGLIRLNKKYASL